MSSKPNIKSERMDNISNTPINRRGGVRTRGGRLPPVSVRDIYQVTGTKKKVVVPNIPQRRATVKQEITTPKPEVLIKKEIEEQTSGRDRPRKPRVLIQTEGSFLSGGPVAKIKKEPSNYEYVPRYAKAIKKEEIETTFDLEMIKHMLDSLDDDEINDVDGIIPPNRLPIVKKKLRIKIKEEPLDCDMKDIKHEVGSQTCLKEKFTKEETDLKNDELKSAQFTDMKDGGTMLLLQFPNPLPFVEDTFNKDINSSEEKKKPKQQAEKELSLVDTLPEGRVGKLQIMKSGKMRLMLGSTAFNLYDGTESESLKEAVSVRMYDEGGDIIKLGILEKKIIVAPALDKLLQKPMTNLNTE